MLPKYVLCPGKIPSKSDNDFHFISAGQLAQLYHVKVEDCIVIEAGKEVPEQYHKLPWLTPRYHGDYDGVAKELGIT